MPATNKVEVTTPSDSEIVVSREFDAPRTLVYLAFTKPELVQKWLLGPPGWTMPICEIDLRVGGKYHYRWRSESEKQEFGFVGTFQKIDPNVRLETIEEPEGIPTPGKASISTSFTDVGQKTRVVYVMDFGTKAARDAAVATGMTDGMEMSFKLLDKLVGSLLAESS